MKNKINLCIAASLLVLVVLGCTVHTDKDGFSIGATTANLSDLKFGRNKDADPPSTTFDPRDKIYTASGVKNSGETHKVKFYVLVDDVKGLEAGAQVIEGELEVDGERSFNFNVYSNNGMPAGRYKAEVVLFDKNGKREIDRKSGTFTVTGSER